MEYISDGDFDRYSIRPDRFPSLVAATLMYNCSSAFLLLHNTSNPTNGNVENIITQELGEFIHIIFMFVLDLK